MHDIGKKMNEDYPMTMPEKSENKVYYPSICLDANKVPELKNVQVGQSIQLVVKGVIKRKSINESDNRKAFDVDVEVRQVGSVQSKKFDSKAIEGVAKSYG